MTLLGENFLKNAQVVISFFMSFCYVFYLLNTEFPSWHSKYPIEFKMVTFINWRLVGGKISNMFNAYRA